MVSNVHLNQMGVTGEGKAYFFKPEIPRKRYCEISAVIDSHQSRRMRSESNQIALPSVNETVCKYYNKHLIPILNAPILRRDNFFANLTHKIGVDKRCPDMAGTRGTLPPPPSAAPLQTSTKIFSRKRLGPMNLTDNTDDEMISILESLPSYVKRIKLGRAKLVNGTLELLDILNSLKSFSKSANSYCHDIMRYYNPHSDVQETLIANLRVAGLLDAAGSSMSLHNAKNKADLNNMIKRPMGMLNLIKNPEQSLQFEGECSEWMEATETDFKEINHVT